MVAYVPVFGGRKGYHFCIANLVDALSVRERVRAVFQRGNRANQVEVSAIGVGKDAAHWRSGGECVLVYVYRSAAHGD